MWVWLATMHQIWFVDVLPDYVCEFLVLLEYLLEVDAGDAMERRLDASCYML